VSIELALCEHGVNVAGADGGEGGGAGGGRPAGGGGPQ
jgi:hypothetical protein